MNKLIFLAQIEVDGGYSAKAIGYSIFTEADNMEELQSNITEAITCHFDGPVYPEFKLIFA